MASLETCSLVLVLALAGGCSCLYSNSINSKQYRFDYEWNEQAEGFLKYHVVPSTWDNARMRCEAEGAVLASPLTKQLKAAIVSFVQNQKTRSNYKQGVIIFSGVNALFSEGDYSSIEGVPLLRLAVTWEAGEPDNMDNSERCLAMMIGHNGTMADTSCDRVLPYVCYKKNTDMYLNNCGTTDPRNKYVLEHRTGSCYKYHKSGLPWSEAYMTCVAEGGYLAIINSDAEAKLIEMIFHRHSNKNTFAMSHNAVFVGFHDWGHFGARFRTIHGEAVEANYHTWAGGPSFNSTRKKGPEEYCGSVTKAVKLYNSDCNSVLAFLCEKAPYSLF